ncbi:hypothetical protein DFP72DRAFT_293400 [Ephemerocybe angulata]|uniref:Uncharacterized protein n=1 Tax=Ephemerocybe angulata TaxID=980116 RepID=A0A8H6M617_9AGAR|nr:hypothetical protein DFP72DRAFT_293400 [Tulosesus angulatus]
MRFSLFTILSIVPLLSLAQAYKYDSPLDAREYIDGLSTREFDDAADLQLRADILAELSTRAIMAELSARMTMEEAREKAKNFLLRNKPYYQCEKCGNAVYDVAKDGRFPRCNEKSPGQYGSHSYKWHDPRKEEKEEKEEKKKMEKMEKKEKKEKEKKKKK